MFPLPRIVVKTEDLVDLCPRTRAAAEAHVQARINVNINRLTTELAYYQRRRDQAGSKWRFREINSLRLLINEINLAPECREAFSASTIEAMIREWLRDPCAIEEINEIDLQTTPCVNM